MWKVKSKLFPRPSDPPMAKKDPHGNIITSQEALKKLYLDTYVQRLDHRKMKDDFKEIFHLKSQLWNERLKSLKTNVSNDWKMEDLECVLKKLKRNLTCDPNGIINEIFFPDVMGSDLRLGLLSLVNGMKREIFFPEYVQLANISTIYKNKGSRMEMKNDRGIFILSVFRKVLDKLLYLDKYPDIDKNMSDSNTGAKKERNKESPIFSLWNNNFRTQ